jgi:multidrug efflux pump subunit AcrA (membrane-fusion protein)
MASVTLRRVRAVLLAAGGGLAAAAAGGCHRSEAVAAPSAADTPTAPAAVRTVHPEPRTLRKTVELSGHVEGFEHTAVYSKTSGYVKALHADIDLRVRKGDLLAELAVPELEDELRQKEANVAQAAAEVEQTKQAHKVATAAVARAEASERLAVATRGRADAGLVRWKAEFDRIRRLGEGRSVSASEVDVTTDQLRAAEAAVAEAAAGVDSARAAIVEARAQRDRAAADIGVAEAKKASAEAERRRQATMVGYSRIVAPFDGVITRRHVHVGHLLQPTGAQAVNGLPLFEISRTDPVRVSVDVPEADAALVRVGTAATVRVPALRDREFAGTVARTSWALDATLRTLRAEIDVPNPAGELRPGMYALGRLSADLPAALVVPATAVFVRDDQSFVVRVVGGRAVTTAVKPGRRQGNDVELLKKEAGPPAPDGRRTWGEVTVEDVVVADAPTRFADGQPVPDGSPAIAGSVARAEVRKE